MPRDFVINVDTNVRGPYGVDQVFRKINDALNRSGGTAASSATNYNNFARAVASSGDSINRLAISTKRATADGQILVKTTANMTTAMQDFGRQTAITIKRYAGFVVASRITLGFSKAVSETTRNVVKFQRELSKVAQLRSTDVEGVRVIEAEILKSAREYGASADELIKAAQILAQSGRSIKEVTTILQALGPATLTATFGDVTKSTESLNAVLTQFSLRAKDSQQVLDIFNKVTKEFNVSIDELFEGLRRSGATFAAFANIQNADEGIKALTEFAGAFTSVISTSREGAAVIGTAFRTILPRLQRTETIQFLRQMNIELLDSQGRFVGTVDAIRRLRAGLEGIAQNDPRLSRVAEQLGGLRQINRILPLLREFAKTQSVISLAQEAQGSVQEDVARVQGDFIVQIDKLKGSLRELFQELSNTQSFRTLVQLFISGANAAVQLAKALKEVIPLLAGIAVIRSLPGVARGVSYFRSSFSSPIGRAQGGLVSTMLTPGERVFLPKAVQREGQDKLSRLNKSGDISGIKTFAGSFVVPGRGNSDSVPMNLPAGSFVIRKKNAFAHYAASGGRVPMVDGGGVFGEELERARLVKFLKEEKSIQAKSNKELRAFYQQVEKGTKAMGVSFAAVKKRADALFKQGASVQDVRRQMAGIYAAVPMTLAAPVSRRQSPAIFGGGSVGPTKDTYLPIAASNPPLVRTDIEYRKLQRTYTDLQKSASSVGVSFETLKKEGSELARRGFNADEIRNRLTRSLVVQTESARGTTLARRQAGVRNIDRLSNRIFYKTGVPGAADLSDIQRDPTRTRVIDLSGRSPEFLYADARVSNYAGQRRRAAFRRFLQPTIGGQRLSLPNVNLASASNASLLALLAGGYVSSTAGQSRAGRGLGGGLTGAAIGVQAGLLTGNPLIALFGGLAGAVTGVITSFNRLDEELQQQQIAENVSRAISEDRAVDVVAGRAGLINTLRNEVARTTGGGYGIERYFTQLNTGSATTAAAFSRLSFGSRLGAIFGKLLPGGSSGIADAAVQQQLNEIQALRQQLRPAFDDLNTELENFINRRIATGGPGVAPRVQEQAADFIRRNQEIFALFSTGLQDIGELNDPARLRSLTNDLTAATERVIENLATRQAETNVINESILKLNSFKDALSKAEVGLSAIDSALEVSSRRAQAIRARSSGTVAPDPLLNLFSNAAAYSPSELRFQAVQASNFLQPQSRGNFLRTAEVAIAGQELRGQISDIFAKIKLNRGDFGPNVGEALADEISKSGVLSNLPEYIQKTIKDDVKQNVSEQTFDDLLFEPANAIKKLSPVFDQAASVVEQFLNTLQNGNTTLYDLVNQRTQVERQLSNLTLKQVEISTDTAEFFRKSLGGRPLSRERARELQAGRYSAIAGRPLGLEPIATNLGGDIARAIRRIEELQNESRQFGTVLDTKELEFLASTIQENKAALEEMTKSNILLQNVQERLTRAQERQVAAQGFLERLATATPADIVQINQSMQDFVALTRGANFTGPRLAQALQIGRQSGEALGIPKRDLQNLIRGIVVNAGGGVPGLEGTKFFERLKELSSDAPIKAIAADLREINKDRIRAFEALAKLEEDNLTKISQVIQEARGGLQKDLQSVFTNDAATGFSNALAGHSEALGGFNNQAIVFADALNSFTQQFGDNPPKIEVGGQVDFNIPMAELQTIGVTRTEFLEVMNGIQSQIDVIINGGEPAPR